MALLGTETLSGVKVEIHAAMSGSWEIKQAGDGTNLARNQQLEGAKDEARRKLAKNKVKTEISFYNIDGRRGIAYGIHAGNGDALVRYDDGESDRIGYGSKELLKGDTPEEVRLRITAIDEQTTALNRERRRLMDEFSIDLRGAVAAAITAQESSSS